ncbi:pre-rRNA-processing protein TSR2 homolog [Polymixia lowei]
MEASTREIFTEAVRAVLETWPVLQIAVDNGFGGVYGQQKADWMVDVVQQYFHDNADLQQVEVEEYISVLLDQEFDTVVDDGSLPQVSGRLCQLFAECQQGALEQVRQTVARLAQKKKSERAKVTAVPTPADEEEEESDEASEAMECDPASSSSVTSAPQNRPRPQPPHTQDEEEGWTVVRKKK